MAFPRPSSNLLAAGRPLRAAAVVLGPFVLASLLALPSGASAAWNGAGSGPVSARGVSMPAGTATTVSTTGRNVTVSWAAVNLPTGTPVAGYTVKRYDSGGISQTVGSGCSGTITSLTCTEQAVPPGTWTYAVAPTQSNWIGGDGARSSSVTIAAPSLSFTSSTALSTLPATLNGSIASFVAGQSVTYRLDDPTNGTVLTGTTTPASIPSGGGATVSVTIPAGTADGAHTVYAVDSAGDSASAAIAVHLAHTAVTPAFDLRDASSGGAATNASSPFAVGGDALTQITATWPTAFSATRYEQYDMYSSLPSGATVSGASFTFSFAPFSGTSCFYFDVRRISTGAVLATHGSASSPVSCDSTAFSQQSTTTSLPEITTTDIANDARIRVYETNTNSASSITDQATVSGSQNSTAFTLYPSPTTDAASGSGTATPWSLAASGDGASYTTASTWDNSFNAAKYLKFTFPAYVPSAASGISASFKHSYSSNTAGTQTCFYYEVYSGTTLIGTHGSATSAYSCTTGTQTDTVALPEVSTAAAADNLSVRAYGRNNSSTTANRRSKHDAAVVTVSYTG